MEEFEIKHVCWSKCTQNHRKSWVPKERDPDGVWETDMR